MPLLAYKHRYPDNQEVKNSSTAKNKGSTTKPTVASDNVRPQSNKIDG